MQGTRHDRHSVRLKSVDTLRGTPSSEYWEAVRHRGPPSGKPVVLRKQKTHVGQGLATAAIRTNRIPESFSKMKHDPYDFPHLDSRQRAQFFRRKRGREFNATRLAGLGLQHADRNG